MSTTVCREDEPPFTRQALALRSLMKPAIAITALVLAQATLAFAMVYPSYKPTPHLLPIGYAGPRSMETALTSKAKGAFSIHSYPSAAAAGQAIKHRDIYGALILGPHGKQLLVATAASPAVAQLLRQAAAAPNPTPTVIDLAPLSSNDPHGATIGLLTLPLVSMSLIAAVALGALGLRRWGYLAALVVFSLVGGVGVMAVVGTALDALPGSFAAIAGVMTLTILAIALSTAGFQRLLGKLGVPLAAVLFLFIGSPASGIASAPQMLPSFWRQIGQFLPLGANASALRGTSYFNGNGIVSPLLVLTGYAVLGAILITASARRLHGGAAEVDHGTSVQPVLERAVC